MDHQGLHLVKLNRPLTGSLADEVISLFHDMAGRGVEQVVISLEDVPFIDSRGLAALIVGYKLFGSRPKAFRLAGLQDQPRLLFQLTMFDCIFQIYDNVIEAVATESKESQPLLVSLPQTAATVV